MASSDVWDAETAALYDEGVAEMSTPEAVAPVVDFLANLAGAGPVLEFAIGTGRIALPLGARGLAVTGVDLSEPMLAALRAKPDSAILTIVTGDMATTSFDDSFTLVYLVFNTISNLRTQTEQVECFRNAAKHLQPGGRFVIELLVPPLRSMPPGQTAVPFDVSDTHLGFDTFDVVTQQCESHHYTTMPDGTVRQDIGHFRYAWPAELDLMAQLAGMTLETRVADWFSNPFTSESTSHVSVYRKP